MPSRLVKILHLSDLHFGRIEPKVLSALESFIKTHKESLDLIILTGDLTQRAKKSEYLEARKFLDTFDCPLFLIPGNHDIPLYNIFLRLFTPYRKFLKYIGPLAKNFYEDDNLAVYGIWSTNHFTIKSGRLFKKDIKDLEDKFKDIPDHKIRIIASHHPLLDKGSHHLKSKIKKMIDLRPHLFLSGHEHQSNVQYLNDEKQFPLLISSGTSSSSRVRDESNSFNLISIDENKSVTVETFAFENNGFICSNTFKTLPAASSSF